MKRLILASCFLILALHVYCQRVQPPLQGHAKSSQIVTGYYPYNSWINFTSNQAFSDQQYFKIKITKEGIYHIPYSTLSSSNIPVSTIPGNRFQIFHNGVEQPLYIPNCSNAPLNSAEYIEFYGKGNDGQLDSALYVDDNSTPDVNAQPNIRYSLYTDTAVYFLTWLPTSSPQLFGKPMAEQSNTNFSIHSPIPYFQRELFQQYADPATPDGYNFAKDIGSDSFDPDYTSGEGYCSKRISKNDHIIYTFNAPNKYGSGPDGKINMAMAARGDHYLYSQNQRTSVLFNNQLLKDTTYKGYTFFRWDFIIPNGNINTSNSITTNSVDLGQAGNDESQSVFYYSFTYPHTLDFNGEGNPTTYTFFLPDALTNDSVYYLKLSGFSTAGNIVLYDLTNGRRVSMVNSAGILNGLVPKDAGNKTCYITSDANFQTVTAIAPINTINNAQFHNFNYVGKNQKTDSAFLIVTHISLRTQADVYYDYRKLHGEHPCVVDVDELYNQFAWGIQKHPLAIRNFCAYTLVNWKTPQYLFLLGKGLYATFGRNDPSAFARTLVPTFGNPAVDNLFTARIVNNTVFDPALPTGRLAAQSGADVSNYLSKVMMYEANQPGEWMKQVLHFGGGDDGPGGLLTSIKGMLNVYQATIEAPLYGGHVTTYPETSTQLIQINTSIELQNRIDSGVSIMTFFAHAAGPVGFAISTNAPNTYHNAPNFPLVIANSCLVGDIHQQSIGTSEQFVIDVNNSGQPTGAIAFLGPSTVGITTDLFPFTDLLYKQIAKINYGISIGKCIKATNDSFISNIGYKQVCTEMTLHGDPAVIITSPEKPDLIMTPQNISFDPVPVTSDMVNFKMNIFCTNIGRAIENDTFNIHIKRTYPTGIDSNYNITVPRCYYKDTFTLTLPVDQFNGVGINTFTVTLDSKDTIKESNEGNNVASTILFIQSNDINPVYPINYAIVPRKDSLILKACTSNPFAPSRAYDFQIDTTDAYNSPMKRSFQITQSGGVVSWANPYPYLKDSTVYYWRVSPHANYDSLFRWREFSFIYIPGKTGWSQAHFFQFKNDADTNVLYNKPKREWDFVTNVSGLQVLNQLNPGNNLPAYTLNNSGGEYVGCSTGLYLAVFDSLTLLPWNNAEHHLGEVNWYYSPTNRSNHCDRARPQNWFIFESQSTSSMNNLDNALMNLIPCGNYVMIFSNGPVDFHLLPISLKAEIFALGGHHITLLQTGQAYIFYAQKCHPTTAQEVFTPNPGNNTLITLNATMTGKWTNGTMNSTVIGPASHWTSLHWQQHPMEPIYTSKDSVYLRILGFNANTGHTDTIRDNIPPTTSDTSLTFINPSTYPFLELQAYLKDDILHTPPQMNRWQIYYDGVPDVALNPSKGYSFYKDPMTGGDTLRFSTHIENISNYPMSDSLHVSFFVYDQNRVRHNLKSQTKKIMAVGDTVVASVSYDSTQNFGGINSFWVEANPLNNPIEQYHYNNLGEIDFKVNKDVTNPILDVTFDGVHILNGEIVSAKPQIAIKLKDENKYLALNDTSLFQINMIDPASHRTRLYFESNSPVPLDHSRMGWTPANMPDNSFKIVINPVLQDGTYTLEVQAIDRSHNYSGANSYKISFEVINHESISEVLNYPNPFSTSTRFVFTLTGSEIPTYFKIQVMTITGHVVREIMLDELGPIHIGRNMTQYAWNGKDEYGDQLANGVYFYRIVTRLDGQTIDKLSTHADQWISHGIGKMYLMR